MLDEHKLLKILAAELDVGVPNYNPNSITVGVVVDTDDPLQNGRLRVFCPNLNDDPKKLQHLPWAAYMTPYGGVISNAQFTRGSGKGTSKSEGATAYGFWGIPEQGSIVLVTCIDGDIRRRVWLGCLPSHQENHTLFHGRYEWKEDGTVDGPLTSSKKPINPHYENAESAFKGEKDSAEWKTRQAEYQASANVEHDNKEMVDQMFPQMSEAEKDEWVKEYVGAHGYDWSGNKALGEFLASRVFGFSTPGFHSFTMDDRPYNSRIRLRTSTGHQIILDDTNERIYVATNEGKSWIEMDSNGNIDGYSERRISMRAKEDINFSTDGTFRVKANKGIYMYSGDTREQEPLDDNKPEEGEIRLHSTGDMHILVEKNLRTLVYENKLDEITKDVCQTVGGDGFMQINGDLNTILNEGNFNISINGDYNHHASGNTSIFSGNDNIIQAISDTEIFSYQGKMDIGSLLEMSLKSYDGDVTMEALEGNMKIMSNAGTNQITMSDLFLNIFSLTSIVNQSKTEIANQTNSGFGIDDQYSPTINGTPLSSGCINFPGGVNISFTDSQINFDALDNIQMKIDDSAIATSIRNINEDLSTLEQGVNELSKLAYENFNEILGADAFPINVSLPNIPQLPNISIRFPAIELPEFDFNFCVNMGDILSIQNFNPIPNGLFVDIDLGGWTRSNFENWFNRQKSNFENSINSFENAANQLDASLDNALNSIESSVDQIKVALENLINVNITDNAIHIASYTIGIGGLNDGLTSYNLACDVINQSAGGVVVPRLTQLHNQVNDHYRSISEINMLIQGTPAIVTGLDYSNLEEMSLFFTEYKEQISNIINGT